MRWTASLEGNVGTTCMGLELHLMRTGGDAVLSRKARPRVMHRRAGKASGLMTSRRLVSEGSL